MRTIILAAGLGTRLRPLTNSTPKSLVQVNGEPMLHYTLRLFEKYGINEARINVHHFGEQIIDFIQANEENYNIDFSIQDERKMLLGSGGAISLAREWLFEKEDSALVWNPDGLIFPNLYDFFKNHIEAVARGAKASMLTFPHSDVGSRYNPVCVHGGRVLSFGDTTETHEKRHFAGGYILTKAAAQLLPAADTKSDVVKEIWLPLVKAKEFNAYSYTGPYQDLGCPGDIEIANIRFAAGEFSSFFPATQ